MNELYVGIDLGTTYSLVSVLVDGEPQVIKNSLGELLTPSAVHVTEDGTVLVGSAARAKAATAPTRSPSPSTATASPFVRSATRGSASVRVCG